MYVIIFTSIIHLTVGGNSPAPGNGGDFMEQVITVLVITLLIIVAKKTKAASPRKVATLVKTIVLF